MLYLDRIFTVLAIVVTTMVIIYGIVGGFEPAEPLRGGSLEVPPAECKFGAISTSCLATEIRQ